jgi:hypothetical protein
MIQDNPILRDDLLQEETPMRRRTMTCLTVLAVALLLLPGLAVADEPVLETLMAEARADVEITEQIDTGMSVDEAPTITLEELEKMFGAHKVCGALCGYAGAQPCYLQCGDAAGCVRGYCMWF